MPISTQVFVRVAQNKTKKKDDDERKRIVSRKKKVEDVEHDFFLCHRFIYSALLLYTKKYVSRRNRFYSVDTKTSTSEVLSICIQMIHMERMMNCQRAPQDLYLLTEDQDMEIPHWIIRPTCSCKSVISLRYSVFIFFILVF